MLLETTHNDKETTKQINEHVGVPFSFVEKLKRKGIGSKRMIIKDVSPNLQSVLNKVSDITYGSIEMRPNGILVHIRKGLRSFAWAIPYYQLYLYKDPSISVHAQGRFVLFENTKTYKENTTFFKTLFDQKALYDKDHPHIDSI